MLVKDAIKELQRKRQDEEIIFSMLDQDDVARYVDELTEAEYRKVVWAVEHPGGYVIELIDYDFLADLTQETVEESRSQRENDIVETASARSIKAAIRAGRK